MHYNLINYTSLFGLIIVLIFFGCNTNNELTFDQTKEIKYEYDGVENSREVRRKIHIIVTPTLLNIPLQKGIMIELNIKNAGPEPFYMNGNDIFLIKEDEIMGTMEYWFSEKEIGPGDSAVLKLRAPTPSDGMPSSIEFKKRIDSEIRTMFSIKM